MSSIADRLMAALATPLATRLVSAAVAIATGGVLLLAMWLTPSPLGHSTHTQLGLGRCTVLVLTGYPCPMCGMTTTFSLMAHLRPIDALVNQPFGVLLFAIVAFVFGVAATEVVWPRDRWSRLARVLAPWETRLATGFLALMFAGWVYKVVQMRAWP